MSVEENKAIVRHWLEIYGERQVDAVEEVIHPDYRLHGGKAATPWAPGSHALEEAKASLKKVKEEYPTFKITIDDMIAEGDRVVLRETWNYEGKLVRNAMVIYRLQEGKIIDDWFCYTPLDV